MPFVVASWNVNSLRVRLSLLLEFLKQYQPDILALQETKLEDVLFPINTLREAGYHCFFHGQKQYNGVALLSKYPLQVIEKSLPGYQEHQARFLAAVLGKIKVIAIYAPHGGSIGSQAYEYKLKWFHYLSAYIKEALSEFSEVLVLGDYNITPRDEDVYDPVMLANQISTSIPERAAFQTLLEYNLYDCFRLHHQGPGHYTWWDYRTRAFQRKLGLRIDHILCSQRLSTDCYQCEIDMDMRKAVRPSDHAAIIAYFQNHFHDFI